MSIKIEGITEPLRNLVEIKALSEDLKTLTPLEEVKKAFKFWLEIDDAELIDVILAMACERMLPGDPVWMFLVAPSGGTKTEMLRALQDETMFYQLDSLTEHTLISGKIEKDENGKMVPVKGVLAYMNNKITILKDFTTLLQKPNEERDAIFAQFRSAYDGYVDFAYGTTKEKIRVNATFGLIAGVTPIIEIYQKLYALLGERFLTVRHHPHARECSKKAMKNLGQETQMRNELSNVIAKYLKSIQLENFDPTASETIIDKIADIGDAVAKLRAPVIVKTWNYIIQEARVPEIEVPTRISKQLLKITQLLALIRGHSKIEDVDIDTMQRIAQDCCIPNRLKILKAFNKEPKTKMKTREINQESGIPLSTCWRELKEMELLRLVAYSEAQSQADSFGRTKHDPDEDGFTIVDESLFNLVSKTTPTKENKEKERIEQEDSDASPPLVCETGVDAVGGVVPETDYGKPGDFGNV